LKGSICHTYPEAEAFFARATGISIRGAATISLPAVLTKSLLVWYLFFSGFITQNQYLSQSVLPLQMPFPGHEEQSVPVTTFDPRANTINVSRARSPNLISFLKKSILFI
jgi:hypothetical protein